MMNLYINDFSYLPQTAVQNQDSLIKDFIDVCNRVNTYSFEKIFLPDNFKVKEVGKGFTFLSFIASEHQNSTLKLRLKSLISNQMIKISTDKDDDSIQYVEWNGNDSVFLKKSFNKNLPIISLRTDVSFDSDVFKVQNNYIDESESMITKQEDIANLSNENHFIVHNDFLNQKLLENAELDGRWNAKTNPFRFETRINQYLQDIDYDKKIADTTDSNYKMSLYLEAGSKIAEMNGWVHKASLSTKNSTADKKRKIFKSLNQSVYLSIDFRHGTFELLDRKGKHVTEYNFRGEDLGNTDTDRSHDIIL